VEPVSRPAPRQGALVDIARPRWYHNRLTVPPGQNAL
jgi:hypothetical protein